MSEGILAVMGEEGHGTTNTHNREMMKYKQNGLRGEGGRGGGGWRMNVISLSRI